MKRIVKSSLVTLVVGSLFLTSCFSGGGLADHSSDSGLMPEAFIPGDVGAVASFSFRNADQYKAIQALEEKLGEEGQFMDLFANQLDADFGSESLSFQDDILPAIGEDFRMVFASRPGAEYEVDAYTVLTLSDVSKMEDVFEVMVSQEMVEAKRLSEYDAYISEADSFYGTIHNDLLLVATDGEELVRMVEMKKRDSLLGNDEYEEVMEEVGSDQVFFAALFPQVMGSEVEVPGVGGIPGVVKHQSIVASAEENGLRVEAYVAADKKAAKEAGIDFSAVPKEKPYLHDLVPVTGLMFYLESYGLEQTLLEAEKLGEETTGLAELETAIQGYMGMDLKEEILSFMDRGFAVALHQNGGGVVPGLSILMDVRSNSESAQELINKLDGQIAGMQMMFEQSLPGAVSRSTVTVMDSELSKIEIDLTAIPTESAVPLPTVVTESEIQLEYGIIDDKYLLISMASAWEKGGETIKDSDFFNNLKDQLGDANQGLMLVAPDMIANYLSNVTSLRDQLGLANGQGMNDTIDLFVGFEGMIMGSKTEKFKSHFSGFLQVK